MVRLLNQIGMNTDYLENASINKIVVYDNNKLWNFVINNDRILPVYIYNELINKIKVTFSSIDNIKLSIVIDNDCDEYINDYVDNLINVFSNDSYKYRVFIGRNVKVSDDDFVFDVYNKAENAYLVEKINYINNCLKDYGFKKKFKLNLSLDAENELLKKIESEKIVDAPKKENINENKVEEKKYFRPKRDTSITPIKDLMYEVDNITTHGMIFGMDMFESKSGYKIITLKVTDNTDSIYVKMFTKDTDEYARIKDLLKVGSWYNFYGKVAMDKYSNELTFTTRYKDVEKVEKEEEEKIVDDAPVKRVELHAHTMMSQMDGITRVDLGKHTCELVSKCIDMGYRGVAITDHNGCQAFPIAYGIISGYNKKIEDPSKHFKGLYGTELTVVDDTVNIVVRSDDRCFDGTTFVVFDTETTGFNAGGSDQMIEIGAVKIKDGNIIDRFDELIDPERHIPDKITELTCITDDMVRGKDNEEEVTKRFLAWTDDLPMVAHNAKFDISFISSAMKKYNLGEFTNTVIDTLELSRAIDTGYARHSLSALVKRYNVPWEEDAHHRADYDAEGTAIVFHKMISKLKMQNFEKISDLDKLISKDEIYKFGRTYHFNAIALNKTGLKNLFKIISLANTTYLYKTPRILRSKLNELREGLIIGSGCYESEVFIEGRSKEGEELTNIINFYDYVEVQPPEVYGHLIQTSDFKDEYEIKEHIKKIINATKEAGKIIVATGDVHHFTREDKIYREIIVNQKVPGGGRHPLAKSSITSIPSQHFRTTNEMLNDFAFLGEEEAYEIVVTNTNKVLDMVDEIEVIIDTGGIPFSPRVKSDDGLSYLDCPRVVTDLVFSRAKDWYGDNLPHNIEERISTELYGNIVYKCWEEKLKEEYPDISDKEFNDKLFENLHNTLISGYDTVKTLVSEYVKKHWSEEDGECNDKTLEKKIKKVFGGVIGGGFDPIYLIAQRLVKHSNDEGFLVGSRGSVGSSFAATMLGITEVNPLPAHYVCPNCKKTIFTDENNRMYNLDYASGYDLPDRKCECGAMMNKDGQDMPFATFLGFNADKVPDIDLNFSGDYQAKAHEYTKVLFGEDYVYRAGTIGTVADKTAFGYVKGYYEDKGIPDVKNLEVERLAIGVTGVKRTTGQHPGGIVVVPDYKDIFDFTPYQYPADDPTSAWATTHFNYHDIESCLLKLDILGHDNPTIFKYLEDNTGILMKDIPMDDKKVMSLFTSTTALGVTPEQINCETGALALPEFTKFVIGIVNETKPTTFAELVKISGLSHGTDVWNGNAQDIVKEGIVPFKEVIGCRDDIMVYLMNHGVEPLKSFKIMEFVRKGKASKDPAKWQEFVKDLKDAKIPDWFIESCGKIKYMFPKAHAVAYVTMAFRIAWFKVHIPLAYYAAYFSIRADEFDSEFMIHGKEKVKAKMKEIEQQGNNATQKDKGMYTILEIVLEFYERGFDFLPIDLYKSHSNKFQIEDGKIRPPLSSIAGLGGIAAENIYQAAKDGQFMCIDDLQLRAKIGKSTTEMLSKFGCLDGMSQSNQISLFG